MGPIQSFTTSLRKTFTISGRSSRSEFWWFTALGTVFFLSGLFDLLFDFLSEISFALGIQDELWESISLALALLIALPWISAACRRGRDAGYNIFLILGAMTLPLLLLGVAQGIAIVTMLPDEASPDQMSLLALASKIAFVLAILVCAWLVHVLSTPSKVDATPPSPNPNEVPQ